MENPTREQVEKIVEARWSIEVYHRELKQTCGIERCQARTGRAQRNHIYLAVSAWLEMNKGSLNILLRNQSKFVYNRSDKDNNLWQGNEF
jgi:hypothetical protein